MSNCQIFNKILNKIFLKIYFEYLNCFYEVGVCYIPVTSKFLHCPCARATCHTPRKMRKKLFKYNSVAMVNYHVDNQWISMSNSTFGTW